MPRLTVEFAPDVTSDESYVTESRNPFMRLRLRNGRARKRPIGEEEKTSSDGHRDETGRLRARRSKLDSHASVTLGAVTLDGEAVDASQLRTLGSNEFLVQLNGLEVGKYELKYTATDELGNSFSDTEDVRDQASRVVQGYAASRLEPHLAAWDAG